MTVLTPELLAMLRQMATTRVVLNGHDVPLRNGVLGIKPETLLALLDRIQVLEEMLEETRWDSWGEDL